MRLSPEALAAGYVLHHRASVTSTMDEARALLMEGHHGPLWVVSDEQTGGRGRHGRTWVSPPGNLYCTLALTAPCEPAVGPEFGFVAGLALHRAVEQAFGFRQPALGIKWPNDLLLDGAKVAGLLLEGTTIGGVFRVLIGFGVNIVSAPEGTPYRAAALMPAVGKQGSESPATEIRDALFTALADNWVSAFGQWCVGFEHTRAAWLERAVLIGETITVRPPSGEQRGVMHGIDASGRLLLETSAGLVALDAGDVFPV